MIATVNLTSLQTTTVFGSKSGQVVQQQVQPLDPLYLQRDRSGKARRQRRPKGKSCARIRTPAIDSGGTFSAMTLATARGHPQRLQIGRHARVLFYRYDRDQGVNVVVNLQRRAVVSVTRMDGVAVPLGAEEVSEAFNIAIRNERVRALLGPRLNEFRVADLAKGQRPESRVEGLRVIATSPRDPCYRRRCIYLLFRDRESYLAGTKVTVNLTAQTTRVERTTPP